MTQALPEQFEFYHLGNVRKLDDPTAADEAESLLEDPATVTLAFQLKGDARGMMLVAFDRGLDRSTYTEMGNVLASRWATRLSESEGMDLMISPPRELSKEQALAILQPARTGSRRQAYLHVDRNTAVEIEAWVLPISQEETANA